MKKCSISFIKSGLIFLKEVRWSVTTLNHQGFVLGLSTAAGTCFFVVQVIDSVRGTARGRIKVTIAPQGRTGLRG